MYALTLEFIVQQTICLFQSNRDSNINQTDIESNQNIGLKFINKVSSTVEMLHLMQWLETLYLLHPSLPT